MKKRNQFVKYGFIFSMVFVLFTFTTVFATNVILGDNANVTPNLGDGSAISSRVNTVLGFIQYIGYAVAVGMLLYIGIKYMMSAANERAELKKGAINYIIGAILIGAVTTIVSFLMTIGQESKAGQSPGGTINDLLKQEWQATYQNYPDYEYEDWLREVKGITR